MQYISNFHEDIVDRFISRLTIGRNTELERIIFLSMLKIDKNFSDSFSRFLATYCRSAGDENLPNVNTLSGIINSSSSIQIALSDASSETESHILSALQDLAVHAHSHFIESENYMEWRHHQRQETNYTLNRLNSVATTIPELTVDMVGAETGTVHEAEVAWGENSTAQHDYNINEAITFTTSINDISSDITVEAKLVDNLENDSSLAQNALSSCDKGELFTILQCYKPLTWLLRLIIAVDAIPISVTLSHLYPNNSQYPIIYINKHFESIIGKNRIELHGRPGTFLQTPTTLSQPNQRESFRMLHTRIMNGEDSVAKYVCCGRNRRLFHNMIGVKPIKHPNTEHVIYVLTIQLEINPDDQLHIDMTHALITDLLHALNIDLVL